MAPGRPNRRSTQQPKTYRVDQAFDFLDSSDSEASQASGSEERSLEGEGNDFSRHADEGESEIDEFNPSEEEEEEEDGDEYGNDLAISDETEEDRDVEMGEDIPRGESIIGLDSDDEPRTAPKIPKSGRQSDTSRKKSNPLTMGRGFGPGNVQPPSRFTKGTGTKVRQRGIEEWVKGGQETRFKNFFGPTDDDVRPALETRDYWHTQETLPSRSAGNLRRSFWISEATHEKEVKTVREWYDDTGRELFDAGQTVGGLDEEQGQAYLVNSGPESMNLLLGNVQKPQKHTMNKGGYMSTSKPFGPSPKRRGWMLNLGARVQEAQWVPNEEGRTQYLAVAIEQDSTATRQYKPMEIPTAPAFTATLPFPGSIQIWAFDSLDNGDLDPSRLPRLEQVICTDWGAPKAFKWCPVGANDSVDSSDGSAVHLGLLAGIWSDGKVRVLDVSHRRFGAEMKQTQYIRYSQSALEIEIPETIPSCIQWLSGTTLAVATASGVLAIWTLTRSGVFPTPGAHGVQDFRPQPWFYKQIADTYILTLSSGYPSRPQFISTTTADGFDRLFDLRSPFFDTCSSSRGRMLVLAQAWHEQTQSFIAPDEYYMLRHSPVRCYYRKVYSMRIESSITCCATSPVHPCILVGGSDGIVTASNPTMKMLHTRARPWQLPWFKHEWRPPVEELPLQVKTEESHSGEEGTNERLPGAGPFNDVAAIANGSSKTPSTIPSPEILSQPLVRITEGYKAIRAGTQYPDEDKRYKEGAKFVTIYEAKSAISRLAWNPNLKFGTWAAAGTNSGILRVEDLGD